MTPTVAAGPLDAALGAIKPEVRALSTYHVAGVTDPPVKLNQNEIPFDLPDEWKAGILNKLSREPWNRYPDTFPERLNRALAEANGCDPAGIVCAHGSNVLLHTIFMATVGAGRRVLIPSPAFSLYEKAVAVLGGEVVTVPMDSDLGYDVDAVLRAAERTAPDVTVLLSPNNPTSRSLAPADLDRLLNGLPGLVVVDEAYIEFSRFPSLVRRLDAHPNAVVLRTFSKVYGLAGLRLGYLIAHPALAAELRKPAIPFNVDRFSELVAMRLLAEPERVQATVRQLVAERDWLAAELVAVPGVDRVIESDANFLIFETPFGSSAVFNGLLGRGVLIRDMGGYPQMNRMLRVSLGTAAENRIFLDRLRDTLRELARSTDTTDLT